MIYRSTKTFTPEQGLSCVFRQWKADSHCRYLHGYALWIKFTFEARHLDSNGWVVDFGAMGSLKDVLRMQFDHKLVVAEDDPELPLFRLMDINHPRDDDLWHPSDVAQVMTMPAVGCEAFARHCFHLARDFLRIMELDERVFVYSCEVGEHGANSAIFTLGDA